MFMKSLPAKIVKPLSVAASIASMMGLVSCFSFYGSKREAVAAKNNYIKNKGQYSQSYQEKVTFKEKYPNPSYQREYDFWEFKKKSDMKKKAEKRLRRVQECEDRRYILAERFLGKNTHWDGIGSGFYHREAKERYPSLRYAQIDDEQNYKECLSEAERLWIKYGVKYWEKEEPKKFLTRPATKLITKIRWIDVVTCIEELNPRQFVCWDRRSDENYRYFRW